ncbi:MAG TPA: CoA-acylating methylmalonate-semialdehyde dehydrogenase, partial [Candidatus Glassbacteria bacterium]|nr:CoA-acylating methylmalonate-semialdehyde dehydrogenase [Candidatus Glassbacteria bacterium]
GEHPVINPADGSVVGYIKWSTTEEVDEAVSLAGRAFGQWSAVPVKERVQVFFRLKALLDKNIEELSRLCTSENGKTVAESKAGILKGIEVVEYATSLPQLLAGGYLEVSAGVSCRTIKEPLGVVAGITPFNFPFMVPLWMIPLALGCGNTMVLKPSEQVPLSAIRLRELLLEAGLPEGVFQVVHGQREVVERLIDHPEVQAITFVGSSRVAQAVYERGTRLGKRVLALGGAKNHLVLLPDADLELSAENINASFSGCSGQRCMAASVLLAVGQTQPVIDRVAELSRKVTLGRDMGPVISRQALERITDYIDKAEAAGAKVLVDGRGKSVAGKEGGFWIGPTILDGVTPDMPVAREEIFGPVLSIIRVETLSEALEIERRSPYGNAAAVYTRNGGAARKCAESFHASMIGINIGVPVPREPFSFGGRGRSRFGQGDITGEGAIEFWTQTRKITERWAVPEGREWKF